MKNMMGKSIFVVSLLAGALAINSIVNQVNEVFPDPVLRCDPEQYAVEVVEDAPVASIPAVSTQDDNLDAETKMADTEAPVASDVFVVEKEEKEEVAVEQNNSKKEADAAEANPVVDVEKDVEVETETEIAGNETEIEKDTNTEDAADPAEPEDEKEEVDEFIANIDWKENNSTVYIISEVNVRMGPSTNYDVVGTLSRRDTIERLATGSNGWTRILYNGEVRYMSSKYLSENELELDGDFYSDEIYNRIQSEENLVGVMYVPSQNMKPLDIRRPHEHSDLQKYADYANSAYCLAEYGYLDPNVRRVEIGDHSNQNFVNNEYIKPGDVAYINMGNRVMRLRCIYNVYQEELEHFHYTIREESNTIATLTCAPGGTRTVTRWEVTSDSDVSFSEFYDICAYHYSQFDDIEYAN